MGTSNLYSYEVQDSIWDEFERSQDDHIVPYPVGETGDLSSDHSGCFKEIGVTSNTRNAGKHYLQRKDDSRFPKQSRKDKKSEINSWSCTLDGDLHPLCSDDTSKQVLSLPSNDVVMAGQDFKGNIDPANEFCSDGSILNEACNTVDNNIYDYPLSHISQTDDQTGFFDNGNGGSENIDLLHFGWPDIGNFEEVDQMFRSSDSTFGMGTHQNEDDFFSYSTSHDNQGFGDEMKAGYHVPNCESSGKEGDMLEGREAFRPENANTSISYSEMKNSTASDNTIRQTYRIDAAPDQKSNLHKEQQNGNKSGDKDGYFKNGGYLHPGSALTNFVGARHLSGNSSSLANSSSSIEQFEHKGEPLPFNCKLLDAAHQPSSFCHQSADQVSVFLTSGPSETSGNPSISAKESSYSSNQILSVDSGQGLSFTSPGSKNQYTENLLCQEDLHASLRGNYKHANFVKATACYDQDGSCKQPGQFENRIGDHNGMERIIKSIDSETGSTTAQGSSFTSFAPEETSLEAKSFSQLQQVMEKLDIRTKLCIRDGLYRLARSAEKRHGCENVNSSTRPDMEVNRAFTAEETNKCTGLMDVETDTNPIDRSIAHLLFHGPRTNPSTSSGGGDAYSLKSSPLIPLNLRTMAEKQVPVEESTSAADKKFVDELLE